MALTVENSGAALIGRPTNTGVVMKTMKVKVLRPFYFNREVQGVGSTPELPAVFASEMIAAGKVEAVPEVVEDTAASEQAEQESGTKEPKESRRSRHAK